MTWEWEPEEVVQKRCPACGATWFHSIRYRPEREEIRLFGLVLRRRRRAALTAACSECGRFQDWLPGSVRIREKERV
jgi:endogenous inhibitor of DNA gyrase (YacG/DUF329 family)